MYIHSSMSRPDRGRPTMLRQEHVHPEGSARHLCLHLSRFSSLSHSLTLSSSLPDLFPERYACARARYGSRRGHGLPSELYIDVMTARLFRALSHVPNANGRSAQRARARARWTGGRGASVAAPVRCWVPKYVHHRGRLPLYTTQIQSRTRWLIIIYPTSSARATERE